MAHAPTPIVRKRSMTFTVLFGLGAAALDGAALYLAWTVAREVPGAWSGVVVLGGLAMWLALLARNSTYLEAPCPVCARAVEFEHADGVRALCPGCHSLIEARAGAAHPSAQDLVLDRAELGIWLVPGLAFPPICARCGRAATRVVPFEHANVEWAAALAVLAGSLMTGGLAIGGAASSVSGGVPHCAEHEDGFEITQKDGAYTLWVRSCAFQRGVAEANRTMVLSMILTVRPPDRL